jgi:hypothetical protein
MISTVVLTDVLAEPVLLLAKVVEHTANVEELSRVGPQVRVQREESFRLSVPYPSQVVGVFAASYISELSLNGGSWSFTYWRC